MRGLRDGKAVQSPVFLFSLVVNEREMNCGWVKKKSLCNGELMTKNNKRTVRVPC